MNFNPARLLILFPAVAILGCVARNSPPEAPPVTAPTAPADPAKDEATRRAALNRSYAARLEKDIVYMEFHYPTRGEKVMKEWAAFDEDAAFQWAAQQRGRYADLFASWAIEVVAEEDFPKARTMAASLGDPSRQRAVMKVITKKLAAQDPEAALEYARTLKDEVHGGVLLRLVVTEWAKRDIPRALEIVSEMEDKLSRHQAYESIGEEWAKRDLPASVKWAETVPIDFQRGAFNGVFKTWAKTDPVAAITYAADWKAANPDRETGSSYMILMQWGKDDPQAALKWLNDSQNEELKHSRPLVYEGWLRARPSEAEAIARSEEDPELRHRLLGSAVIVLAEHSPKKAVKLLLSLDPPHPFLVGHGFKELYEASPKAMIEWVANQEDGYTKNQLMEFLVGELSTTDLNAAANWTEKIPDPAQRKLLLQHYGPVWLYHDQSAAIKHLTNLGLNDAEIENLIQKVEQATASKLG
jgi:hypothetical protein